MKIGTILERKRPGVVTIDMLGTLGAAAELMTRHHIAALVVTEHGAPIGLLSERDIVEQFAHQGKFVEELRIRQVIGRRLIAISPHDGITRAMALMAHTQVHHLPVIKENELVGIVSRGDLVRHRLEELEPEANVRRDGYIAAH